MTHNSNPRTPFRMIMLIAVFCFAKAALAQYDTLHLYYNNISTQPHDTTLAKMDRWIKSLGGKHQDVKVVAYYHKLEFKKYAQERVDEMFLVINRKARSLFTITETVARSGKNYQRTTVDLIYKPTASAGGDKVAADKGKSESAKSAASESPKKGKDEEKSSSKSKEGDKKSDKEDGEAEAKPEKAKKEKAVKEEKEEKKEKKDEESDKKSDDEEKKSEKKDKKKSKSSQPEKQGKTESWEAKPIE